MQYREEGRLFDAAKVERAVAGLCGLKEALAHCRAALSLVAESGLTAVEVQQFELVRICPHWLCCCISQLTPALQEIIALSINMALGEERKQMLERVEQLFAESEGLRLEPVNEYWLRYWPRISTLVGFTPHFW